MTRFNAVLAVLLLVGGTILAQSASAQSVYSPQTPAVSPWMGLWQKNTGTVDNYHSVVLPQLQLNQTLQMQNAALNRQEAGLQNLSSDIAQPKWDQTRIAATGQGATFMNYSHYYGGNRQMAHPVARSAARGAARVNSRSMVSGQSQ